MTIDDFTPTQRRILEVLKDGMPHKRKELIDCLQDEMADRIDLNCQLSLLRRKLRPIGHEIVCEYGQRMLWYRHVLLIGRYQAMLPAESPLQHNL